MRVTTACVAVSIAIGAVAAASPAVAQSAPQVSTLRRVEELTLGRLLDDAVGRRRSPDRWLRWEGHFLKGTHGRTYVPFTVRIDTSGYEFQTVAVGLRVLGFRSTWNDAFAVDTERTGDGRMFRAAFSVNPGVHRVLLAVQDRSGRRGAKVAVLERQITVPDFSSRALKMSSVVVADRIDDIPEGLSDRDRVAYPYTFGRSHVVPAGDGPFTTHDKLTVAFQIYNVATFEDGKPDVEVRYNVVREGGPASTPVGSTAPQTFNQETLPEEFSLKDGFQLTPIQTLPLSQFEPGSYRLRIEVEDVLGNARTEAEIPFTIAR